MLALALIPKRDRVVTSCQKCGRTVDLRGGGLYFYATEWKRPRPVCPWCAAKHSPQVSLAGALYAQAAQQFNREHPEEAANFALIQTLDALQESEAPEEVPERDTLAEA